MYKDTDRSRLDKPSGYTLVLLLLLTTVARSLDASRRVSASVDGRTTIHSSAVYHLFSLTAGRCIPLSLGGEPSFGAEATRPCLVEEEGLLQDQRSDIIRLGSVVQQQH